MTFVPDSEWLGLPEYWSLGLCSDVAIDSQDRVWVGSRGDHPVSIWNPDGTLNGLWNETNFQILHGLYINPADEVWLVDAGLHVARKYSPAGDLLMTLGKEGQAVPTVTHAGEQGGPFNMPTAVGEATDGTIFVSDGYGNRRVHKFTKDGELISSWGRSGEGPGEFSIVHGITVTDDGVVIVSDRENNRVQLFDLDGEFIREIPDLLFPASTTVVDDLIYIVEMGLPPNEQPNGFRVVTFDGELVGQWYYEKAGTPVGGHGIALDSTGSVYIADLQACRMIKLVNDN